MKNPKDTTFRAVAVFLVGCLFIAFVCASILDAKPIDKPPISTPESLSQATPGQVWRCEEPKGCVAYDTNVDGGPPKKIIFRQGDIVYEATGLTLSTDDGWVRVRRKGNE